MRRIASLFVFVAMLAACGTPKEEPKAAESATPSAIETIMSRKSVRAYTEEKLTGEEIETLLRAAMAAPTGMNLQPWRFVVVTDQAVKDAMQGERRGPRAMYSECAALFVICGETMMTGRDGEKMENGNWTADCAAATENLLLAAHAMGLGAVWTACYPYEERMSRAIEVLGIPEGVTPYAVVPVGHPAEDPEVKDKWKPENIHYEKW